MDCSVASVVPWPQWFRGLGGPRLWSSVLNALRYDGVAGAAACIDNDNTCGRSVYRCGSAENEGVMKVVVKKWGTSASVRIPASIMAAAALSLDQPVDVREEAGRIVIEPIRE